MGIEQLGLADGKWVVDSGLPAAELSGDPRQGGSADRARAITDVKGRQV